MNNPWRYCNTDPPPQYTRVEIKSKDSYRYVGYRYKNKYYETIGNYIINNPFEWRFIPVGSYLWSEIIEKIRNLSLQEEGEKVYGNKRK